MLNYFSEQVLPSAIRVLGIRRDVPGESTRTGERSEAPNDVESGVDSTSRCTVRASRKPRECTVVMNWPARDTAEPPVGI
jgi:hypothetical protein